MASVVEGHGELSAVPLLLRRVAAELHGRHDVRALQPHRVPRSRMRKEEHLGRAVSLQGLNLGERRGGVLVLLDSDDDEPAELESAVTAAASRGSRAPVVVVAVREYEAWFLAAVESLRDHRAVKADAESVAQPESVRGAKEALARCMHETYRETLHQAAFSALLDPRQAEERSPSFHRLVEAVGVLLGPRGAS